MKKVFSFLVILSLTTLLLQCSTQGPGGPGDDPQITIKNIWLSNQIDNDNDGFSSYARLNFDLDTNVDEFSIAVKVGVRNHSADPGDLYDVYLESSAFTINGETSNDAVYISIGHPNSELNHGNYDFLLHVFNALDFSQIIAEASPTTHLNLNDIKFENSLQELTGSWISYIDDGLFESTYKLPTRLPTGASYGRLTEKFEKPATATTCILRKVRIHIPQVDNFPDEINITLYDDENNWPNDIIHTFTGNNISSSGWNTYDLDYDLTDHDVFYISVPPSQNYAISIDDNSSVLNGYWYESVSSNPPREGWVKRDLNYAIEVYLEY